MGRHSGNSGRRRGNRSWGAPLQVYITPGPTAFEHQVAKLALSEDEWSKSETLRLWARKHRNFRYIPEWLLETWHMEIDESSCSL